MGPSHNATHWHEALVVLFGAAVLAFITWRAVVTGTAHRRGGKSSRHEAPFGYWLTVSVQGGLTLFLFGYACYLVCRP